MKTYHGYRTFDKQGSRCTVTVRVCEGDNGYPLPPIGKPWEWHGVGAMPEVLAQALVEDCCGLEMAVPAITQRVRRSVVAKLPIDGWTLTQEQIELAVVNAAREAGHARPTE